MHFTCVRWKIIEIDDLVSKDYLVTIYIMPVPKQLTQWSEHVAKVKKENPSLSLKQVLSKASKTYSKKSNETKQSE